MRKKKTEDKIKDKIKDEIKSVLPTCKTHDDFIEKICKILDKYFDASYDTIMDHMTDSSDQNHIDIWFSNFIDNPGCIIPRIDTILSKKTIENGVSFDDLHIWYGACAIEE